MTKPTPREYKIEAGTPLALALLDNYPAQEQFLEVFKKVKDDAAKESRQALYEDMKRLAEEVEDFETFGERIKEIL